MCAVFCSGWRGNFLSTAFGGAFGAVVSLSRPRFWQLAGFFFGTLDTLDHYFREIDVPYDTGEYVGDASRLGLGLGLGAFGAVLKARDHLLDLNRDRHERLLGSPVLKAREHGHVASRKRHLPQDVFQEATLSQFLGEQQLLGGLEQG